MATGKTVTERRTNEPLVAAASEPLGRLEIFVANSTRLAQPVEA